jgi:hypothetical protein
MSTVGLVLSRTPARATFKLLLGQANHFIVTILVGLEAVRSGSVERPEEFSTSWAPRDLISSVDRSREFALRGALASTSDALDAYLRLLNRTPKSVTDPLLSRQLEAEGSGNLGTRIQLVADFVGDRSLEAPIALLRFGVYWRNRLVHFVSDSDMGTELRLPLLNNAESIQNTFQTLSVHSMLRRFDTTRGRTAPTFKESTALIRAAQMYVTVVDTFVLNQMDVTGYCSEQLRLFIDDRDDRIVGIWGKDRDSRVRKLIQHARQFGFTDALVATGSARLVPNLIEQMADWSVSDARQRVWRSKAS